MTVLGKGQKIRRTYKKLLNFFMVVFVWTNMAQKSYYDLNSLLHHSMMIIACCLFVACRTCQPFARRLLSLHDTKRMWVESSFYHLYYLGFERKDRSCFIKWNLLTEMSRPRRAKMTKWAPSQRFNRFVAALFASALRRACLCLKMYLKILMIIGTWTLINFYETMMISWNINYKVNFENP